MLSISLLFWNCGIVSQIYEFQILAVFGVSGGWILLESYGNGQERYVMLPGCKQTIWSAVVVDSLFWSSNVIYGVHHGQCIWGVINLWFGI